MTISIAPDTADADAAQADFGDCTAAPPQRRVTRRKSALPVDLATIGGLLGFAALLPLPAAMKGVLLALFIATAPGSALLTWVAIPARVRLGLTPVLGMALITIIALGAMWSYRWDPDGILRFCVVAVGASSALWYHRNGWPRLPRFDIRPPSVPWRSALTNPSILLTLCALVLWGASIPGLPGAEASNYGLLFSGTGPMLAVAIVVTAIAFVLAIRSAHLAAAVSALAAAIVVGRLTTTVGTEMPLYDWTYKHIAVVDYIITHSLIQPNGTDIYAKWPGFFVTMAWFSDVSGVDPTTVAHVFAPIVHVLIALTVFSAGRALNLGWRVSLTAAFIVEIVNWVGQDYFSPQAWTLVLAFGILILLLVSRESRPAGVLTIVLFIAMVPSHQLTPFWVLLTTSLLVATKRAKPWWIVVAMAMVAGIFLLRNLESVLPYGLLSGSSPVKNAASNFDDIQSSQAKWFASLICRSLSVTVIATAALAAVWLRRRRGLVISLCILGFSPLLLLLGQSYGGEAIFRVYLYGLLGLGLLIAPALVRLIGRSQAARRIPWTLAATTWLVLAALAGLNAYVTLWPMIVETREQVEVMESITAEAETGARFMMMRPNGMPTRVGEQYARQTLRDPEFDNPLGFTLSGEKPVFPTREQLGGLEWAMEQRPYDMYVLFSAQSRKAIVYYNEYRAEAVDEFQRYLYTAPGWEVLYRNGETVVFRHKSPASNLDKWKWKPPE